MGEVTCGVRGCAETTFSTSGLCYKHVAPSPRDRRAIDLCVCGHAKDAHMGISPPFGGCTHFGPTPPCTCKAFVPHPQPGQQAPSVERPKLVAFHGGTEFRFGGEHRFEPSGIVLEQRYRALGLVAIDSDGHAWFLSEDFATNNAHVWKRFEVEFVP